MPLVLAVRGAGDFDVAGHRRARRRGRSSMSARRRAPRGERAPSVNRSAPPRSPISARLRMHRSAAVAGRMGSHVPASALSTPGVPVFRIQGAQTTITQNVQPVQAPQYGELELPADFVDYGTPGNMDLDAAINMLVGQNLDLMAAKLEIPMAEADVLTANLRANPIFYADQQLIPYGHFSFLRPGGPQQSDVNINYPLDISFKRAARTASAREAKSVTEAQLQDAVRNQIDNLYSVYEGVVSAGLTLKFSEVYLVGNQAAVDRHRRTLPERADPGVRPGRGQGQRVQGPAPGQGIDGRPRSRPIGLLRSS